MKEFIEKPIDRVEEVLDEYKENLIQERLRLERHNYSAPLKSTVEENIRDIELEIGWLDELQQYRAIGTVEECKTAVERMKPKKPIFYAHNYYCIECDNLVGNNEFEWQRFLYCEECGQALDWSE